MKKKVKKEMKKYPYKKTRKELFIEERMKWHKHLEEEVKNNS